MGQDFEKQGAPSLFPSKYFWFLVVVGFSVVIRALAIAAVPRSLSEDTDLYRALAQSIIHEGRFALAGNPTAFRPPVYPLLLVPGLILSGGAWWGIALLHLVLTAATVAAVYALGLIVGGTPVAVLAGLLVAMDPLLNWQATQIMSETAAAALTACTLLSAVDTVTTRRTDRAFLTGLLGGLAALTRSNLLPWSLLLPVLLGVAAWRPGPEGRVGTSGRKSGAADGIWPNGASASPPEDWGGTRLLKPVILSLAGVLGLFVVLAPWASRNRLVLGSWILGTTHGGVTFLLANNDDFYDHLGNGRNPRTWRADEFQIAWTRRVATSGLKNEIEIDKFAYRLALDTIRRRPVEFCQACLIRLGWIWSLRPGEHLAATLPFRAVLLGLVMAFYAVEYALAIAGLVALTKVGKSRPELNCLLWLGVLLLLVLSCVHSLYWSNVRMRAPAMPFLALVAAFGVHWLTKRVFTRDTRPT